MELTSTYVGTGPMPGPGPVYGRPDNATVAELESVLAALEHGSEALLFGSGMAAIAAAAALTPPGGRVVAPAAAYNTTAELLRMHHGDGRIRLQQVESTDTEAFCAAIRGDGEPAALVWLESPGNPLLQVPDVRAITDEARQVGALVVFDNTFATPLLQQPLEFGADVVVHSVTKYIAGHSDLVLGATVTANSTLAERLRTYRRVHGAIAGPFEAWLALRGVRTMGLRVTRQVATAGLLAERLTGHPAVRRVGYPGLPGDPGHERASRQMSGFGAMLTIELADAAAADRVVHAVRVWVPATSLGGVESLLERRRRNSSEPDLVPDGLIRLSVGIEDPEDLWADLVQALAHA